MTRRGSTSSHVGAASSERWPESEDRRVAGVGVVAGRRGLGPRAARDGLEHVGRTQGDARRRRWREAGDVVGLGHPRRWGPGRAGREPVEGHHHGVGHGGRHAGCRMGQRGRCGLCRVHVDRARGVHATERRDAGGGLQGIDLGFKVLADFT